MTEHESQEARIAALEHALKERQTQSPKAGPEYLDRELPVDLFGRMTRGKLTPREAREIAHERWRADDARGGSMNDMVRRQLEAQTVSGSGEWLSRVPRDENGRFKPKDDEPAAAAGSRVRPLPTR